MYQSDSRLAAVTIGLVTALPVEIAAARLVFKPYEKVAVVSQTTSWVYELAAVESRYSGTHALAIASLSSAGNNPAAIRAVTLVNHCPNVQQIFMCGIAGAAPHPTSPERHVRLGDIVVVGEAGILQYDRGKTFADKRFELRAFARPPSRRVLNTAMDLYARDILGETRLWDGWLREVTSVRPEWGRPAIHDVLLDKDGAEIPHPEDPDRRVGCPRVFIGPIASGNVVQGDPDIRDQLVAAGRVLAVEMEGSGIADAALDIGAQYFIVRGTVDYCDSRNKDDGWHRYSSLVAAAYTRALIFELPLLRPAHITVPAIVEATFQESTSGSSDGLFKAALDSTVERSVLRSLIGGDPALGPAMGAARVTDSVRSVEEKIRAGDIDAATAQADRLDALASAHWIDLPPELRESAVVWLVEIELLKVRHALTAQAREAALSRARRLLSRIRRD